VNCFRNDVDFSETDTRLSDPISFADRFQREIFVRFLFSALTDSDWLSTEEHFDPDKSVPNGRLPLTAPMATFDRRNEVIQQRFAWPLPALRGTHQCQWWKRPMA
jgi:hypothetical protein